MQDKPYDVQLALKKAKVLAALAGLEGLPEPSVIGAPDIDPGVGRHESFFFRSAHSRTSMAWRRPSLMRLKQIETMKIMHPGSAATQGLW